MDKKAKILWIILLIITILFVWIIARFLVLPLTGTQLDFCTDEYSDFYLFKYKSNVNIYFSSSRTYYYFLPGQKEALRMKIKSDVKEMAKSIGENYPDVVEDIYVSDDLRVHVTIYKGANLYDINEELETIRFRIQLYHELYGDTKSDFFDIRKSRNTKP